ncbi:hypothetical protein BKA56DRAFT_574308 [Ilyonectria sp. MPI-CAGE-AT-0026]|nr:hypothetical protein BKA56DRAFT_574308 [Ilyonectria sp. MPI-CAGE-AT-0026]
MDPKNDIRERLDPRGVVARRVLQTQQPEETSVTDVGWDTNGLDCLVAVIRRIYAFMPGYFHDNEEFAAAEEKNPILRYAWQMLDIPEEATDATRAQQAAEKKAVMSKLFPGDAETATHFHFLNATLGLMSDTFWSFPQFHLFAPRLQKDEGDSVWRVVPWDPPQIVAQSIIVLDCLQNPGMSLQEAVDSKFGVKKWYDDDGEADVLLVCKRPSVVRVHYYSNPDQPSRSFDELRTFDMPFTQFEGTSIVRDGRCRYAIIAIARLRRLGSEDMEHVRLYGVGGCNVSILANNPAFNASKWSVGSPSSHAYAMFFGRADHTQLSAFPEVNPDAPDTIEVEAMMHAGLLSRRAV